MQTCSDYCSRSQPEHISPIPCLDHQSRLLCHKQSSHQSCSSQCNVSQMFEQLLTTDTLHSACAARVTVKLCYCIKHSRLTHRSCPRHHGLGIENQMGSANTEGTALSSSQTYITWTWGVEHMQHQQTQLSVTLGMQLINVMSTVTR